MTARPKHPAPERLLTVREVAAWLSVHPKTVLRYCKLQNLPFILIGGRRRFDRTQVSRWLRERGGATT